MAGKKGNRAGKSYKAQYEAYKGRATKNRRRRLEKHLKENPEDTVAKEALNGNLAYRRKKPKSKLGWIPTPWTRDENHPINTVGPGLKRRVAMNEAHSSKVQRMIDHGQIKKKNDGSDQPKSSFKYLDEHEKSEQSRKKTA